MTNTVRAWYLQQRARYRYRQGLDLIRKGNLQQAQAVLQAALPDHPHPTQVWNSLGMIHWQQEDFSTAKQAFAQAIAADAHNAKAYGNRGLLQYQMGQPDQAEQDWAVGLQLQPNNALILYNRGLLKIQQQQYEAALEDLNRALVINPNLAEAYLHRGNVRQQLDDLKGAMEDWELALCNDLRLEQARMQLQQFYRSTQDDELTEKLQAALKDLQLTVAVQRRESQLEVAVNRPKGVGVNYMTLPDVIRKQLLDYEVVGIRQFLLVARVADQHLPEWQQFYPLYQNLPCPEVPWGNIGLTALIICPPLGIPALAYGLRVRPAFKRGDYPAARQAANTAKALCLVGSVITTALVLLVVGYWGVTRLNDWFNGMDRTEAAHLLKPVPPGATSDWPPEPGDPSAHTFQRADESKGYLTDTPPDNPV